MGVFLTEPKPLRPDEVYPPYDELDMEVVKHAIAMFALLGLDLDSPHLKLTPYRFVYYIQHLMRTDSPTGREFHLTTFPTDGKIKGMAIMPDIPFWSACSHHTLPFVGVVKIGYIPSKDIIGLSKIPLKVREIARGLWTQEDLTEEIAEWLYVSMEALGVGVYTEAVHTCQLLDLMQPPIPRFGYHALRGVFLAQPNVRDEFTRLISMEATK